MQQMQQMHMNQQECVAPFGSLGLPAQPPLLDFNAPVPSNMHETSPRYPAMQAKSWAPPIDFHFVAPSSMRETSPRFLVQPQSWAPPMECHAAAPSTMRETSPSKAASCMNAQNWNSTPSLFQPQPASRPSLAGRLDIPFLSFDPSRPMQKFRNPGAGECVSPLPSPLPSAAMIPRRGWQEVPPLAQEPPLSPMPCSALVQPQSPGHLYGHQRAAPSDISPRPEAALSPMPSPMQCSSFPRPQSPVNHRWCGAPPARHQSFQPTSPGRHQAFQPTSPGRQQAFRPSSFAEFGLFGRAAQLPSGRQSFGTPGRQSFGTPTTPLHHTQPLHGIEPLHHTQPYAPSGAELLHPTQTHASSSIATSKDSGFRWDAPLPNNQLLKGRSRQPSTPVRRGRHSVGGVLNSHRVAQRAQSPVARIH